MGSEWSEDGGLDKRGQGETNKGWFTHHTNFFFQYSGSVLERRGPTWRGKERDWDSGIYQGLDGKRARRVNEGVRGQALDAVAAMGQSHLWDGPDASRRVWSAGRNVLLLARGCKSCKFGCRALRTLVEVEEGAIWAAWSEPPPLAGKALWCSGAVLTLSGLVASRSSPAR